MAIHYFVTTILQTTGPVSLFYASPWKVRQMVHHPTDERRLVSRVLRHWREMATGRRFPSTVEIDPWIVGNDWESCFVIRLGQEREATFLMVGAALLPHAGIALEYKPIVMCPPHTVLASTLTHVPRCIADSAPLSIDGTTTHCGAPIIV